MRLTAPPVDGKANKECIRFFSKKFKIAKSSIEIVKGKSSRMKVLKFDGLSYDELTGMLQNLI